MKRRPLNIHELAALQSFGLDPDAICGTAAAVFQKEEYICTAGEPLQAVCLISEGVCKSCFQAENGRTLLLGFCRSGDILGDIELLSGSAITASTVQAVTEVHCIYLPLETSRDALLSNVAFLRRAGKTLSEKLRRTTQNSASNILYSLDMRLCSYISVTQRKGVWQEKLTQVAEHMGVSYRHLLRTLRHLTDAGLLAPHHTGGFLILNQHALEKLGRNLYQS